MAKGKDSINCLWRRLRSCGQSVSWPLFTWQARQMEERFEDLLEAGVLDPVECIVSWVSALT